jgi:hypothetical protein
LLSWLLTFEADHQLQESMDALAMAAYAMLRVLFSTFYWGETSVAGR